MSKATTYHIFTQGWFEAAMNEQVRGVGYVGAVSLCGLQYKDLDTSPIVARTVYPDDRRVNCDACILLAFQARAEEDPNFNDILRKDEAKRREQDNNWFLYETLAHLRKISRGDM